MGTPATRGGGGVGGGASARTALPFKGNNAGILLNGSSQAHALLRPETSVRGKTGLGEKEKMRVIKTGKGAAEPLGIGKPASYFDISLQMSHCLSVICCVSHLLNDGQEG